MVLKSNELIFDQLDLADALLAGRDKMLQPQDLPGRYGRVVHAIDHVLAAVGCPAVVGGGWAVWRHGYFARVTQDLDIVLHAESIEEFLQVAAVHGFQILTRQPGRWPKLIHKETHVEIDILPEGERPGIPPNLAPTTIPSPARLGAEGNRLCYIRLPDLIELKLAAGRLKDAADVLELLKQNRDRIDDIRQHLSATGAHYIYLFDDLLRQSQQEDSR